MADQVGQFDIRGENISRVIRVFEKKKFKLKPLLLGVKSDKWTETYYKEDPTILTAAGTRNIKEIGRMSQFPTLNASWTKVSAQHFKYGGEGEISMEDVLTNAINVQARTLEKIAEAIINSVDIAIYAALTAEASTSGTVAASATWDNPTVANRNPIDDGLAGIQAMDENNVDVVANGKGIWLFNPKNYRSIISNSKVINNPSFKTADVVSNGRVGQIAGLTIVKTTSVTDDEAMIIISQRSAAWK
ncbi:hypothetical protein LCGC14_2301410, partial [marine sediment metagenome]